MPAIWYQNSLTAIPFKHRNELTGLYHAGQCGLRHIHSADYRRRGSAWARPPST